VCVCVCVHTLRTLVQPALLASTWTVRKEGGWQAHLSVCGAGGFAMHARYQPPHVEPPCHTHPGIWVGVAVPLLLLAVALLLLAVPVAAGRWRWGLLLLAEAVVRRWAWLVAAPAAVGEQAAHAAVTAGRLYGSAAGEVVASSAILEGHVPFEQAVGWGLRGTELACAAFWCSLALTAGAKKKDQAGSARTVEKRLFAGRDDHGCGQSPSHG